jgi:hypothetical protein
MDSFATVAVVLDAQYRQKPSRCSCPWAKMTKDPRIMYLCRAKRRRVTTCSVPFLLYQSGRGSALLHFLLSRLFYSRLLGPLSVCLVVRWPGRGPVLLQIPCYKAFLGARARDCVDREETREESPTRELPGGCRLGLLRLRHHSHPAVSLSVRE